MEEKKKKVNITTVTRNTAEFSNLTDNIYATVALLTKRANQLSTREKKEIQKTIEGVQMNSDNIDEVYDNHEQAEKIRHFELRPKPTLSATDEYLDGRLEYINSTKEEQIRNERNNEE